MPELQIRVARPEDAAALLEIYAPYVRETAVTFEYDVPSVDEFSRRITSTLKRYPYLAAFREGTAIGYAYASSFHDRPAYGWGSETSIYIRKELRHTGIGRQLMDSLLQILKEQGILSAYACVAASGQDTTYLTDASIRFHQDIGYQQIARFPACGYKFNTWYDIVWMEKKLAPHGAQPSPVCPFSAIRDKNKI